MLAQIGMVLIIWMMRLAKGTRRMEEEGEKFEVDAMVRFKKLLCYHGSHIVRSSYIVHTHYEL